MTLGRHAPAAYVRHVTELLRYTDYKLSPFVYVGFPIALGLLVAPLLTLILFFGFGLKSMFVPLELILSFVAVQAAFYGLLYFAVDRKARFAETVLPDVLQLTASHIRAGMTPDQALLMAARPEFGVMEDEIRFIAKEAMTGRNLEEALIGITRRVRSSLLDRTFKLVAEGIRSGGELATLLDETAEDIRTGATLRSEARASVMMYIIFIFLAAGIAAPALYAVSTYLIESMTKLAVNIGPEAVSSDIYAKSPFQLSYTRISSEFVYRYSLFSIISTAVISGLVLGLVEEGREKAGIKYIPILILLGVVVFFVTRLIVADTFSGLVAMA